MKNFNNITRYLVFTIIIATIAFWNCKKKEETQIIKRSIRSDIDIYLVPNKYNLLETNKTEIFKPVAHFNKSQLVSLLKPYKRKLEDLQTSNALSYLEKDDIIAMKVEGTSHSTIHPYDQDIPILFYGKWFQTGEYKDVIHLAHIVPTIAQILKIRNPNGIETTPIKNILKTQEDSIPEIIVTIVIDQGGKQVYDVHSDIPKTIQNLFKESAYFPNAQVGHIDSHTAAGHASIGTGSYTGKHGIIGNTKFHWKNNQLIEQNIYINEKGEIDTSNLKVETLADVLDYELGNEVEVISQAHAMRASIGMAGHGSYLFKDSYVKGDQDFVYWIANQSNKWETDPRFYSIHRIVAKYDPYRNYKREYPRGKYDLRLRYKADFNKYWYYIMSTPAQAKMESKLFMEMIQQVIIKKKKHKDQLTDLAYLNLKSFDKAGHLFGWESLEARETFLEIDKQIGIILEFLKKNYGDNFILVLTADHGCAPLPEISGGKRLKIETVFKEVNSLLPQESDESIIDYMTINQISLDKKVMLKHNITDKDVIQKIKNIEVDGKAFFKKVYSKFDLF
ncbi:MAG: alkaline phosphatase family protein [Leptospiraceae bacterium]|nr:alkaline phosphatase family protein [Leptospiraceae bacterium]MCP5496716.1 alkaline phosphatase family protein [Leptospiraceae bacterium]